MNCPLCKKKVSILDKLDGEVRILDGKEYHRDCLDRLILKNAKDVQSVPGGKQ